MSGFFQSLLFERLGGFELLLDGFFQMLGFFQFLLFLLGANGRRADALGAATGNNQR
jgi:hypothetical protein